MKIIVCKNYDEMSAKSAEIIASTVKANSECVLGLATGSTPEGMYACLADMYKNGELSFKDVKSVNLDEYYPITPDNDQSYRYFMNEHLFDRVNIDKSKTAVPDGTAEDVEAFCSAYEASIDALGGFNEPADELIRGTHLTALTPDTIEANARFFASENDVPKHALTMGIQSVFKARKLLLLANGKNKAEAIKAMLQGNVTTSCPATLLCLHPDVTVICDEDAYSLV